MRPTNFRKVLRVAVAVSLTSVFVPTGPAVAQLRVTEVMYNTLGANDDVWEWIEVQNLGEEVDLHGAFMDGLNDFDPPLGVDPNVDNTIATNTIIPAGRSAVLYNGFQGQNSPLSYNDALFRDAWGLEMDVPLIAVDFWPGLPNSSSDPNNMSIGIWADRTDYNMDITGTPGDGQVTSFDNALASINYDVAAPWPGNSGGVSITYSGTGDIEDGANWEQSAPSNGATTSTLLQIEDSINSSDDTGNPGLQTPLGGTPPGGLVITEVMYNPASPDDNDFEWIEVLNNTGGMLDFGTEGYFLDDAADNSLEGPNITSGSIGDGETAVLFSESLLSVADMEDIWGDSINFIPVADWSPFNNGGDTIGFWDNQSDYDADAETGGEPDDSERGVTEAVASVIYQNGADDWPDSNGAGSIWLTELSTDAGLGENWLLAAEDDGGGISYSAMTIGGTIDVHPGGDVGSPGSFAEDTEGVAGDYNDDGVVNAADYVVWRNNEGQNFTLTNERPDASTPGVPDEEDYEFWVSRFGETSAAGNSAAVPEPAGVLLYCLASMLFFAGPVGRYRS